VLSNGHISCTDTVEDNISYTEFVAKFTAVVIYIFTCRRFCNHSIWRRRNVVRRFSGEAAEPTMQRNLTTVSDDDRHCSAVDVDIARSLWECPLCRHQCWLCSYKQVDNWKVILADFVQ